MKNEDYLDNFEFKISHKRKGLEKRYRLGFRQLKRWGFENKDITKSNIGIAGQTRCRCSCKYCGNPRRKKHIYKTKDRLTIAEKRALQYSSKEYIRELIEDNWDFNM